MKKLCFLVLGIILCFSLFACRKMDKNKNETTLPTETTTIPGMDPTILDPTIETNIPNSANPD